MPELNTVTDPNLPEPKGVAAASGGMVYIADGAGSGQWIRVSGYGQYQDTNRTVGTPTQNISTGVRTKMICDGGFLTEEYLPSDAAVPLWDVVNYKHVPIAEFDTYDVRVSFTAENYAGTSPFIDIELDIGGSIGTILDQTIPLLSSGNAQSVVLPWDVFTGTTYFANGGEFYLTYTGTGTCDIYATSVKIERKYKDFT